MPYVQIRTSKQLTQEEKELLKQAEGKHITLLPNKTEKITMVEIIDQCDLYLDGTKEHENVYIHVGVNAPIENQYLENHSRALMTTIKELLNIDYSQIYITYQVYSPWHSGGKFMK